MRVKRESYYPYETYLTRYLLDYYSETSTTYPNCRRVLTSLASLRKHMEKYCRYREGKKAKRPVVARQSNVVEIEDVDEVWTHDADDATCIKCCGVSVNGRVRDYEILCEEAVSAP